MAAKEAVRAVQSARNAIAVNKVRRQAFLIGGRFAHTV